jgi:hypothetical protein
MPNSPVPWVGLAALAAMFLLPLLRDWLFRGARTSKHWLGRHSLATARSRDQRAHLHPRESQAGLVLRGQLRRLPETLHGARAAIDPAGLGADSRPGVCSAHSAESNRSVSQRRLGAHVK